jgi:hypothetical protein
VAFADEDAFPKYGALHVVGILILGIAVIFIMLGCILKFYWKPFIGPDLEMHLSPNHSFRNIHIDKINSGHLRLEKETKETTPVSSLPFSSSSSSSSLVTLQKILFLENVDRGRSDRGRSDQVRQAIQNLLAQGSGF